MPTTDLISPFVVSCAGGLTLNKDVFSMQPGEALILQNFEPDIKGGYSWPDFVKVAKAYNISAMTFDNKKNFKTQLKKIMNYKKPILVDVRIDPLQFMLDTPI